MLGIVCVYAQPLRSGTSQGGTGRMVSSSSFESAGAQHLAAWRASPPFDAEEADLCARQRGLQLLHR